MYIYHFLLSAWSLVALTFTIAAATPLNLEESGLPFPRETMEENEIRTVIESLGLPAEESSNLVETLSKRASGLEERNIFGIDLLQIFCTLTRRVLGNALVDSLPLNQTLVNINWSQACVFEPSCILLPSSPQEVSRILSLIRLFRLPFAVRSGGHSPNPGWSSIEDPGVLIDLQRLNSIEISDDAKVVSIGPGQHWGDVMNALDERGVSVIGGRTPSVGVGGLVLGGGLFHLSQEFGLAADNVKNFEIVTSDGSIRNANAHENRDLFWALKGGGPNFGIVTRFDMYTIPVRDIFYEARVYAPDDIPAVLETFAEWQTTGARDLKSTIGLIVGLDGATVLFVYGEHTEWPSVFSGFDALEPLTVAVPPTNGTCASITELLGSLSTSEPMRHDYRGASSCIDAQLYKDMHSFWRERALDVRERTGANQTFVLQPIPISIVEKADEMGGNPMGLPRRDHQWWTTLVDWRNADDDELVRSVAIDVSERWRTLGEERGLHIPFLYMNDAGREQSPLASYGEANIRRLREISRRYDRDQIFQNLQSSGFLLSSL